MKKIALLSAVFATTFISLVYAHSGATGVVKTRMDMMSDVAKSIKTIGTIIKGETEYNSEIISTAALKIQEHTKNFPKLFPKGTTEAPSEALDTIWSDWETFDLIFKEMSAHSQQLSQLALVSSNVNAIKPEFGKLAKTCAACHQKFRLKK